MKSNPFSTQALVRGALKATDGPLRTSEIRDLIGLAGEEGYARVHRALESLRKAREVERVAVGRYQYAGERPDGASCTKQRRMQRIMWVRSKGGNPLHRPPDRRARRRVPIWDPALYRLSLRKGRAPQVRPCPGERRRVRAPLHRRG